MVSYPGVLLSTTSIPVWAHTHFLGSLIASSSMSSAASALTLLSNGSEDEATHKALARFEDMAAAAEAIALGAYLGSAKKAARPLLKGKQSKLFWLGAVCAGILAPLLLRRSKSKVASGLHRSLADHRWKHCIEMVHHLCRSGIVNGRRSSRAQRPLSYTGACSAI